MEHTLTQHEHPKEILDLTTINATNLTYRITFIIPTSHDQQLYTIDCQKTTSIENVILHPKYWIDMSPNSDSALLFTLTKSTNNIVNITAINITTNITQSSSLIQIYQNTKTCYLEINAHKQNSALPIIPYDTALLF